MALSKHVDGNRSTAIGDGALGEILGGWANTELEKAMPVDFQIRNAKIQEIGQARHIMDMTSELSR